ncbi:MAG TPA: lysophospholipid acyltransferase family protein [Microlunatus sp.]
MFYWIVKSLIAQPLFSAWWRPWVEGESNIPEHGAAILVGNHLAEGETILLPAILKRRLVFTPKSELFAMAGFKGLVFKWFLRAIKMLPLDRSGGKASADDMAAFAGVLHDGGVLIMFPEGSRSPDGRLYKGRTGAARLALQTGAPVIPVAVSNTKMYKNKLGIPRLHRPGIRVGKPLDFSAYRGAGNDRDTLRWITDEMMNAIMELSGQTYVDVYVSAVKAGLRRGQPVAAPVLARPGLGRPVPAPPRREAEAA